MKYFIANWKARIDADSCLRWGEEFSNKLNSDIQLKAKLRQGELQIIVCPPFPFLYLLRSKIDNLENVCLGTQDISAFDEGTYTGEVTAKMLQNVIQYAIIGHSERRHFLNESEELIEKKINQAQQYHIEPIFCLRGIGDMIFPSVKMIAYEPIGAIWPGKNEDPQKVVDMKKKFSLTPKSIFIYGGSVSDENVYDYVATNEIDGFLIGNASLDPARFLTLIKQAFHQ